MKRMNAVRAAKSEAEKPRSPQERLKEAAREYTVVMGQIGKEPDRIINNIKKLESLMDVCAGTPYEALVKKQLEIQRAKASMR
jgi:phosphoglycerate dehydrogenase-like enzyme